MGSSSNLVLNQDSNGFDKHQILGKESALISKPLKVYSRIKAKRTPNNVGKEWICLPMEEANEDMDSDYEGDKPIFRRPDSSTDSSTS